MYEHDEIDEVTLNVLLAEGVDLPTAYVASQTSRGRDSKGPRPRRSRTAGLATLIVVVVVLWLLLQL